MHFVNPRRRPFVKRDLLLAYLPALMAASLDSVNASGVSEAISGAQVTETWTGSKANPGPAAWSVNEVGLRVSIFYTNIVHTNVLIIRDVLPATVTVQPGDTLNLQYSITVTA